MRVDFFRVSAKMKTNGTFCVLKWSIQTRFYTQLSNPCDSTYFLSVEGYVARETARLPLALVKHSLIFLTASDYAGRFPLN